MTTPEMAHGFRHDPLTWIQTATSLPAAIVRTHILREPRAGDAEILATEIEAMLGQQRPDGSLGDTSKGTGDQLLRVLELGADTEREEVQRAAAAILSQTRAGQIAGEWYEKDGKVLSIYALHALCLLGMGHEPEVPASLEWFAAHPEAWNDPRVGCPWTPAVFWSAIWAGREYAAVEQTVRDGLRRVADGLNAAGCCGYNDPWGFTDAAARIDAPEARQLVTRQVPLMLRSQHPDGSFGGVSVSVFRALVGHDLLEPLRRLPPLQSEWRTPRELALPPGTWFSLAWDGQHLWSYDLESQAAAALSVADGSVVRRVPIADCHAICWWDGALAAVGRDPKTLRRVDAVSGEVLQTISLEHMEMIIDPEVVGDKVLVGDAFMCSVSIIDPTGAREPGWQTLGGPFPACLAATGDGIWHADRWAPAILKSDFGGRLLEWGGKEFGIQGLAFDGRQLWALDGEARRICVIERIAESEDWTPGRPWANAEADVESGG